LALAGSRGRRETSFHPSPSRNPWPIKATTVASSLLSPSPRSRETPARVSWWCAASSSPRLAGFLSVLPLRICSDSPMCLTSLLELRAVWFFFLGAGVDLGFAVNRTCFLFRLVFCSPSCASSELPKVKSTPESTSLLWISVVRSFLFRSDVDILVPMRCSCGAVVLVSMWSGCSCFDSMRLFLFRFGAVVLVSMQCGYSCGR
jgi:hypothetical protein